MNGYVILGFMGAILIIIFLGYLILRKEGYKVR